jgi:exopolysaccharide biosynthesis protein
MMIKYILTILFFCNIISAAIAQSPEDGEAIRNIQWTTKTISPGIVLRTCESVQFFNSVQSISYLEIDTLVAQVDFKIDYSSSEFHPVSVFGKRNNAIAAINGTYFMTTGGSIGQAWHFIKIDGVRKFSTVTNEFSTRATGVISMTDGNVDISTWNQEKEAINAGDAQYALVCGPLLMDDGVDVEMWDNEFVTARHPRSCVANTSDGKILIIAVDGRQTQRANGMNLYELRYFVRQLGCIDAMNLDGGGSTALYVAGENNLGIVNTPIDENISGKEREVGNILYITPRNGSKPYCIAGKSPGGVSGMRMWIKANGEVTKNNTNQLIAPYVFDYTGYNEFEFKKRTQEAQINWNENRINSHPTLAFDSASLLASKRKVTYSTFYSVNTINRNGTFLGFDEYGSSHPKFRYFLMANNANVYVHDGSNTTGGLNYTFIPYQDIFDDKFNLYNSSFGKKFDTFFMNGKEQLNASSNFCTRDYITAQLQIGARNSYPVIMNPVKDEYYYRGELAEIIAYPDTLTASEHNRVESYLAVKYGITMDNPEYRYTASYGIRWWDGLHSAYKPYSQYVTFIGRDDNSELYQLKAKSIGNHLLPRSESILHLIHNSNEIANDQYFLCAGATNDNLTLTTEINTGDESYSVMKRHWKFNTSNSPSEPFNVEIEVPSTLNLNENHAGIIIQNGSSYQYKKGTMNLQENILSVNNITVRKGDLMHLVLDNSITSNYNINTDDINIFYDNDLGSIRVNGLPDETYTLSCYSLTGNLYFEKKGYLTKINTTAYKKGIYIIVLNDVACQIVARKKIIITK